MSLRISHILLTLSIVHVIFATVVCPPGQYHASHNPERCVSYCMSGVLNNNTCECPACTLSSLSRPLCYSFENCSLYSIDGTSCMGLCPPGSTEINGICVCTDYLSPTGDSCINTCPPNTIIYQDPDTLANICQCAPNHYLDMNGDCVASCDPSETLIGDYFCWVILDPPPPTNISNNTNSTEGNNETNGTILMPESSFAKAAKMSKAINQANAVMNEILSGVTALLFQGIHSMRSQANQHALTGLVYMNVDFPQNYLESTEADLAHAEALMAALNNQTNNNNNSSNNDTNGEIECMRLLFEVDLTQYPYNKLYKNQEKLLYSREKPISSRNLAGAAAQINLQSVTNFDKYIANQNFVKNTTFVLIYFAVSIVALAIIESLLAICKKNKVKETKWYYKALIQGSSTLRWGFLLNQCISKYQIIAFFAFLGVYNAFRLDGEVDKINLAISIIAIIVILAILLVLFAMIWKIHKKLNKITKETEMSEFLQRTLILYKELKRKKMLQILYSFFLVLRLFGYALTFVYFAKVTYVQLGYLHLTTFLMILYLFKWRPFVNKVQLIITLIYEFNFWIAIIASTIIYGYKGSNQNFKEALGYVIMVATNLVIVINLASSIYGARESIFMVLEKVKLKKPVLGQEAKAPFERIKSATSNETNSIEAESVTKRERQTNMKDVKETDILLNVDTHSQPYQSPNDTSGEATPQNKNYNSYMDIPQDNIAALKSSYGTRSAKIMEKMKESQRVNKE